MELSVNAKSLTKELNRLGSFIGNVKNLDRMVIGVEGKNVYIAATREDTGRIANFTVADSKIVKAPSAKSKKPGVVINGYTLSTAIKGFENLKLTSTASSLKVSSTGKGKRLSIELPTLDWLDIKVKKPRNSQPLKISGDDHAKMTSILSLTNLANTRKELILGNLHLMFRADTDKCDFIISDGNYSALYTCRSMTMDKKVLFEIEKPVFDLIHYTSDGNSYSLYVGDSSVSAIGLGMKLQTNVMQSESPYDDERIARMNSLINKVARSKLGFKVNKQSMLESLKSFDGIDTGDSDLKISKNRGSGVNFSMSTDQGSLDVTQKVEGLNLDASYVTGRESLTNILSVFPNENLNFKFNENALLTKALIKNEKGIKSDNLVYMNALIQS